MGLAAGWRRPRSSELEEVGTGGKHSLGGQRGFLGTPAPPDRQASEPEPGFLEAGTGGRWGGMTASQDPAKTSS